MACSFATGANAEWTKWGETEGAVLYYDKRTLKVQGNIRFIYRLVDYHRPNDWGDLSSKAYMEVNCETLEERHLTVNYYAEPLGGGQPTDGSGVSPDQKWRKQPFRLSWVCSL